MALYAFNRSTNENPNLHIQIPFVGDLGVSTTILPTTTYATDTDALQALSSLPDIVKNTPIIIDVTSLNNPIGLWGVESILNIQDYPLNTESSTISSAYYPGIVIPGYQVTKSDQYHTFRASINSNTLQNCPANPFSVSITGATTTIFWAQFTILVFDSKFVKDNHILDFSTATTADKQGRYELRISFDSGSQEYSISCTYTVFNINSNIINNYKRLNNVSVTEVIPSTDPYTDIVPGSGRGGGGGTGDFTGETIGEPSIPSVSALNSGFISAYVPSLAQLNALASYMWTSDFADNLKKVFGDNPMNTILGLSSVPLQAPTGGTNNVVLGNIDTGIAMPRLSNQYKKVSCGSITLAPKYNAFLDYEPYTSIDLYLPYIGMVQLSTNDCMGKSISVTYTVDILTGACVANVACGGSIMYTFNGACATQMPVTNNDYSNVFKSAIDAATSIVGAVAGGAAGALTGNVAGAVGAVVDGVAGAANAAMNAHPTVNRSGGLAGSAGLMAVQRPFIVWTCPKMVAANGQNSYIGYPIFATYTLGNLSGYTEVENINLGIAGATNEELSEIKTLLKNGVIL